MSCDGAALKEKLTTIAGSDYRIDPGHDYYCLALEMMEHIGSPDPLLRDDLIYDILAHWIMGDRFTAGQLKEMLEICLDGSHLFCRIGASGDDSVLTRSFSALVLALIIGAHRNSTEGHRWNGFLSDDELRRAKRLIEDYMIREKDARGYLGEKGWAHAVAHAADALDEFARCPSLNRPDDFANILSAIKAKAETDDYAFVHDEDERMVTVVISVIGRNVLDSREIIDWIDGFPEIKRIGRYPEDLYLRTNVKTFLRSLYFRLLKYDATSPVLPALKEKLFKASRY